MEEQPQDPKPTHSQKRHEPTDNGFLTESRDGYLFLLQLSDALRPIDDPIAIEETATRLAMQYLDADRCYYCQIVDGNAIITRDAIRGNLPSVAGTYCLDSFALLKQVVNKGQPFVVEDAATSLLLDEDIRAVCLQLQIIAFVDVPVIKLGQPVGVLCLVQATPRSWTPTEVQLALETAERTWAAVERARAQDALRISEDRQAFLLSLSDALRPLLKSDAIAAQAIRLLGEHLKADRTFITEVEPDGLTLQVRSEYLRRGASSVLGTYHFSQFGDLVARQLHQGLTLAVEDVGRLELSGAERANYEAVQIGAYLLIPLLREGRLAAYFTLNHRTPRPWTLPEQRLAQQAAERTWVAVERARVEEAFHETERRLRLAIEATELGTWEWNLATNQVYWNEQHFRLFGMEPQPQPLTPEAFMNHVHPTDRERISHLLQEAITERGVYDAEFCALLEDGTTRWMSGYGRIVEERDGQPLRMSGVMFDVDERRRAQDALREADQRKDAFLALLAHELRNPLAPVRNGLQLLAQTHQQDQILGTLLPVMNRQMDHVMRLVDDLLDVSRISRGTIEVRQQRLDLTPVVAQAVESMQPLYTGSGRQLSAQLPDLPLYVNGDATRLHQVVTNLLTNGLRYTHPGGQVWLTLEPHAEQAVLHVRDNGIGLATDQLAAIFGLFVQVDQSLARSHGGLGVGLSLVQELVGQHGGRVEARSTGLEQGSTFIVYLPLLRT